MRPRTNTEEDLRKLTSIGRTGRSSTMTSSDLEWDDTFVSADDLERSQLLGIVPCQT